MKLGRLYLAGGRWDGVQVVDQSYVDLATSPLNGDGVPEQCPYGLLWWVARDRAPAIYFAGGHGGQYVVGVPELDVVAVTTADAEVFRHPKGQLLRTLVMWVVLQALSGAG